MTNNRPVIGRPVVQKEGPAREIPIVRGGPQCHDSPVDRPFIQPSARRRPPLSAPSKRTCKRRKGADFGAEAACRCELDSDEDLAEISYPPRYAQPEPTTVVLGVDRGRFL